MNSPTTWIVLAGSLLAIGLAGCADPKVQLDDRSVARKQESAEKAPSVHKPDLVVEHTLAEGEAIAIIEKVGGFVRFENKAVVAVHLPGSKVTDASLAHLKGLTGLKYLYLGDTQITDAGLEHLKGLRSLQILNLSITKVTDEGVKKLQQALPQCKILGKPEWVVHDPAAAKQLSVSISVPQKESKRIINIYQPEDNHRPASHFHVVVTNTSDRDQRLWETWNSWGYFNLHFDVLDGQGNVAYSIAKNQNRTWTVNCASSLTLKPGEHFILDVYFDRETWVMPFLKTPKSQGEFKLKLRAVFEITPDAETIEFGVWTGEINSSSDEYTVRYWR